MSIVLLAERLRVEERQLVAAFAARGLASELRDPASLAAPLQAARQPDAALVIDRGVTTAGRAVLATLLNAGGAVVVNRAATARLLADRLAFLRHLIVGGIPTPDTVVCFGEQPALDALRGLGYPALALSVQVDPAVPDALVPDTDAAEAVIEHRATLGHETTVLIQRYIEGRSVRLAVVGTQIVGIELMDYGDGRTVGSTPYRDVPDELAVIGQQVIARLGSGVYAIKVVESDAGPVVTGAGNLVDFRSLSDAGIDVAGAIASFALEQLAMAGGQDG